MSKTGRLELIGAFLFGVVADEVFGYGKSGFGLGLGLGVYPLLRVSLRSVPLLQRVTFVKATKVTKNALLLVGLRLRRSSLTPATLRGPAPKWTSLSGALPASCRPTHCAAPALGLHPSRDWRRLLGRVPRSKATTTATAGDGVFPVAVQRLHDHDPLWEGACSRLRPVCKTALN